MTLEPNTILILFGIIINAGVIINHFTKLERRFVKIEQFLKLRYKFDPEE